MLFWNLTYSPEAPHDFKINSNIKAELQEEVLSDFLQAQIGQEEETSPAVELDTYHIKIQLDLTTDTYYSKSDTGNAGLTAGIIMDVLNRLPKNE